MQYIDEEVLRELYQRAGNVTLVSNNSRGASALVQRRYKSEPAFGMMDLARKINQRESIEGRAGSRATPTSWVFGEYKVFGWVLACLSKASNLEISQFGAPEYRQLEMIFRAKTPYFLRYETKMFASHKHASSELWDPQEIQTLQSLLLNYPSSPNWKDISYQLFCISEGRFFRSLNQCREKWMNHLNPTVSKDRWTVEEDRLLFELAEQFGCRWAKISKEMGNRRTEHMVKNRYNWYTRRIGRKRCPNDITRILKNTQNNGNKEMQESQSDAFSEFQLSSRERKELKESLLRGEIKDEIQLKAEQKQRRSRLPRTSKHPKSAKQRKARKSNKERKEQKQHERLYVNLPIKQSEISEMSPDSEKQVRIVAKEEFNESDDQMERELRRDEEKLRGQVRIEEDLTPLQIQVVKEQWGQEREKVKVESINEQDQLIKEQEKKGKLLQKVLAMKMQDDWQNYYPFMQLMMPHHHWN